MIHIEHIAVWSDDIDRLAAFYASFFGAVVGDRYVNAQKGFASRFLRFATGARLELMSSTQLAPVVHERGAQRMGLTHFAVSVGSAAAVNALTERVVVAGHECVDGPRWTGDGYYESVVLDPDGNRVEITI